MHPGLALALWLCAVLLTQRLPIGGLAAVLPVGLLLAGGDNRRHFFQLLRRTRWILLSIFLTFLLFTPGERLVAGMPATSEGLLLAVEHGARLLVTLLAVAWLVGGHTRQWLLAGLLSCGRLFSRRTSDVAVIRLALTLQYAAAPNRSWQHLLRGDDKAESPLTEITLEATPLAGATKLLTVLVALAGVIALLL